MIDVRVKGYSVRELLAAPPKIDDQLEAVCRTMDLQVKHDKLLNDLTGQAVELWKDDKRWFYGFIQKRGIEDTAVNSLLAYDPLFFFKKNPDDYYYKNRTATKIFQDLADKTGVKVAQLANTKVVLPNLYYQAADPDEIAIDSLARTKKVGGGSFWYRFDPDESNFGLHLFEKTVPKEAWAFQIGVNLTKAKYEESAEDLVTQVKLINRETGKVVFRKDTALESKYGQRQHFEEINNDEASTMERKASQYMKDLTKIKVQQAIEGVNPGNMPQLFSGDVIYVEEKHTNLIGAYHIRNISASFEGWKTVVLSMDIQRAPHIPAIQYEDATEDPAKKEGA
jgi:hypothetical protein